MKSINGCLTIQRVSLNEIYGIIQQIYFTDLMLINICNYKTLSVTAIKGKIMLLIVLKAWKRPRDLIAN